MHQPDSGARREYLLQPRRRLAHGLRGKLGKQRLVLRQLTGGIHHPIVQAAQTGKAVHTAKAIALRLLQRAQGIRSGNLGQPLTGSSQPGNDGDKKRREETGDGQAAATALAIGIFPV